MVKFTTITLLEEIEKIGGLKTFSKTEKDFGINYKLLLDAEKSEKIMVIHFAGVKFIATNFDLTDYLTNKRKYGHSMS